ELAAECRVEPQVAVHGRRPPARGLRALKVLVICRPQAGVTPAEIADHTRAEVAALKQLKADGALLEAYLLGGPGAVFIMSGQLEAVRRLLNGLPLVQSGLIETEAVELHPFPGFNA